MARKDKEEKKEEKAEATTAQLTKDLIRSLNSDEDKTGRVAWNLANDEDNPTDVKEFVSTGSTLLDYIIANKPNGGVPVGKLTEIAGEEASGKSLICAHIIAETQRRGGLAVYLDTENAANPDFLQRLGVDLSKLVFAEPECVEAVGEVMEKSIMLARTKAKGKLVTVLWDGVAATPSRKELDGDFDLSMDLQLEKSKVISKMMRKLTQLIGKERVALVVTNQLKTKIGVMYGDPMTTPGGKAVGYHASVRLRLFTGKKKRAVNGKAIDDTKSDKENEKETETGDVYGIHTSCKTVKSRLGPPWRKCEFDILFASGIDDQGSWFQKLHELSEIELAPQGFAHLSSVPSGDIEEDGVNKGKDLGLRFRRSKWKEFLNSKPLVPDVDPTTGEVRMVQKKDKNGELIFNAKQEPVMEPGKVEFDVLGHVKKLLEKHMVVRYDKKPHDADLDPESLMDAEAVQQTLMEG